MSSPAQVPGFAAGPITVEVPASSANLGPGFDCLGIALGLHDVLVGQVATAGLSLTFLGEGAHRLPPDERSLVIRAMRQVFGLVGDQPPGLRVELRGRIPHSRGLGSSSAAIVGGLVLARALLGERGVGISQAQLLQLAHELEGHPDNVAPALLGGLIVSGHSAGQAWAMPAPVDPELSAMVFVPQLRTSTRSAREVLPAQIDHAEAAANSSRTALLMTVLAGANAGAGIALAETDFLWLATEDFLHQRQREPVMPASYTLVQQLRKENVPAVISGAGPTVLAFVRSNRDNLARLRAFAPPRWNVWHLPFEAVGAQVVTQPTD